VEVAILTLEILSNNFISMHAFNATLIAQRFASYLSFIANT